jgi:hypothetical protein
LSGDKRFIEWSEKLIENLRNEWRKKTLKGFLYTADEIKDIYR